MVTCITIAPVANGFNQLVFRIEDENDNIDNFVVQAPYNLIDTALPGLNTLLFCTEYHLSVQKMVGLLLSCDQDKTHFMGAVLPTESLETLCTNALSTKSIKSFFQVYKCFKPSLECFSSYAQLATPGKATANFDVELPTNSIWSLLILSEIFGAVRVSEQCASRLASMLQPISVIGLQQQQKQQYQQTTETKSGGGEGGSTATTAITKSAVPTTTTAASGVLMKLPDSVFGDLFSVDHHIQIESALVLHFLKYGAKPTERSSSSSSSDNNLRRTSTGMRTSSSSSSSSKSSKTNHDSGYHRSRVLESSSRQTVSSEEFQRYSQRQQQQGSTSSSSQEYATTSMRGDKDFSAEKAQEKRSSAMNSGRSASTDRRQSDQRRSYRHYDDDDKDYDCYEYDDHSSVVTDYSDVSSIIPTSHIKHQQQQQQQQQQQGASWSTSLLQKQSGSHAHSSASTAELPIQATRMLSPKLTAIETPSVQDIESGSHSSSSSSSIITLTEDGYWEDQYQDQDHHHREVKQSHGASSDTTLVTAAAAAVASSTSSSSNSSSSRNIGSRLSVEELGGDGTRRIVAPVAPFPRRSTTPQQKQKQQKHAEEEQQQQQQQPIIAFGRRLRTPSPTRLIRRSSSTPTIRAAWSSSQRASTPTLSSSSPPPPLATQSPVTASANTNEQNGGIEDTGKPQTFTPEQQVAMVRASSPSYSVRVEGRQTYRGSSSSSSSTPEMVGMSTTTTSSSSSSSSKPKVATPESLKLSREIAILRLQEARMQSDLQKTKIEAEKELRQSRLKSLELKTKLLATGAAVSTVSPGNKSKKRNNNTESVDNSSATVTSFEEELRMSNEARQRAAARVREQKLRDKQQEELEAEKKRSRSPAAMARARAAAAAAAAELKTDTGSDQKYGVDSDDSEYYKGNSSGGTGKPHVHFEDEYPREEVETGHFDLLTHHKHQQQLQQQQSPVGIPLTPYVPPAGQHRVLTIPTSSSGGVSSQSQTPPVRPGPTTTTTSSSPPSTSSRRSEERQPWEESDGVSCDNRAIHASFYSKEALQAVGFGMSPTKAHEMFSSPSGVDQLRNTPPPPPPLHATAWSKSWKQSGRKQTATSEAVTPPTATATATAIVEHHPTPIKSNPTWVEKAMISIQVIRAWDLPVGDILGAPNPYAVFDWAALGRASTQAVRNTSAPVFGSTLQFRSPFESTPNRENEEEEEEQQHSSSSSSSLSPTSSQDEYSISYRHAKSSNNNKRRIKLGAKTYVCSEFTGLLRVYVYNRNESVSDELLGFAEFDPISHLMEEHSTTLHLIDRHRESAGCIEIFARISL